MHEFLEVGLFGASVPRTDPEPLLKELTRGLSQLGLLEILGGEFL